MADNNLTTKEEFLLNPVEEHNITDAAVASFETNLKHPLKVTVPITPQQDLRGMPNPYPAGASVNLIPDTTDTSNGYVAGYYLKSDGTRMSEGNMYISEYFEIDPAITYTWSCTYNTANLPSICFYDESKTFISGIQINKTYTHTFNPPENAVYARSSQITYITTNGERRPNQGYQLEVGSTATEYRRYSNICPIEGWTKCDCNCMNENFFDIKKIYSNFYVNDNTITVTGGAAWRDIYTNSSGLQANVTSNYLQKLPYLKAGSYRMTCTLSDSYFRIFTVNPYTGVVSQIGQSNSTGSVKFLDITLPKDSYITMRINSNPVTIINPFLKLTGSSSEYAVHKSSIIPIAFTDPSTGDPMTIYGGSLTLNEDGSVDLSKTHAKIIIDGTKYAIGNINTTDTRTSFRVSASDIPSDELWKNRGQSLRTGAISNWATEGYQQYGHNSDSITFNPNSFALSGTYRSYRQIGISIDPVENATIEYIREYLGQNPLEICYILDVPKTYHFPNVGQLKAFLGQNNVWSDIRNVDVKYLTQHSETGLEYRGDRALELRRRAMMADAPTIHTTVGSEETGGLASFKSYVKAPVKKIEIPFSPKQDLHGYNYPYPAGVSVNLIPDGTDAENGYVAGNVLYNDGTINHANANYYVSEYFEVDPAITYTWSNRVNTNVAPSICFYDENKEFISGINIANQFSHTFTPPEGAVYAKSAQTIYAHQEESSTNPAFQLEVGSTATPYQRYSNICPIEEYNLSAVVNADTKLFEFGVPKSFTVIQEGSGTPSVNNIRPIKPRISILRDNGSSLNIYQGTITINEGGTSTVVETRGFRLITSASSHLATRTNAGGRWQVIYDESPRSTGTLHASKSNALATDNSSGVWNYQGPGTVGTANWSSALRIFIAPPAGITNFTDYYAWLDRVGTLEVLYPLATNITYNLSASETERALQCLTEKAELVSLTFNQSGDHEITPIQDGSGTPSPQNVRPIHPGLTFTRDDDSVLSVYGGTLTVSADGTGTIASEWAMSEFDGSDDETWVFSTQNRAYIKVTPLPLYLREQDGLIVCNRLYGCRATASTNLNRAFIYGNDVIGFHTDSTLTVDNIREWLQSNPLQMCYKLATPTTYTLSVTETNRALEALGLTQHIGPLYGGTVTINPDGSADVVAKYGKKHIMSSDTLRVAYNDGAQYVIPDMYETYDGDSVVNKQCKCTVFPKTASSAVAGVAIGASVPHNWIVFRKLSEFGIADYTEWLTFLDNNNVEVTYPLATPQTYHFSNLEQLKVWLGENNFWCDISDDITVKYWNRG